MAISIEVVKVSVDLDLLKNAANVSDVKAVVVGDHIFFQCRLPSSGVLIVCTQKNKIFIASSGSDGEKQVERLYAIRLESPTQEIEARVNNVFERVGITARA